MIWKAVSKVYAGNGQSSKNQWQGVYRVTRQEANECCACIWMVRSNVVCRFSATYQDRWTPRYIVYIVKKNEQWKMKCNRRSMPCCLYICFLFY